MFTSDTIIKSEIETYDILSYKCIYGDKRIGYY